MLGDRILHVGSVDRRHGALISICQASKSDRAAANRILEVGPNISSSTWESRHRRRGGNDQRGHGAQRLSLSLLSVCRQVHSEAALIPLATNTFAFETFYEITRLVKRLIPEQRKAVRSLSTSAKELPRYCNAFNLKRNLAPLTGLRHFTMLSFFEPLVFQPQSLATDVSSNLTAVMNALKYIKWESAVICVGLSTGRVDKGRQIYSTDELDEQCENVERLFLLSTAEIETEEKRAEEQKIEAKRLEDERREEAAE